MNRPNCIKDWLDTDIKNMQQIAEAEGWTEIKHDMISERQVRRL